MQPIDYETPRCTKRSAWPFWLAFFAAYLPGLLILNFADDAIQMRVWRSHNDGGIMFLSLFLSPLFAAASAIIKNVWRRYDSIWFAVTFAVFAPLLVYLLWVTAAVLSP